MTVEDRLVEDYLRRLRAASRGLRRGPRRELLADIEGHIAAARAQGSGEAYLRNVLDDLGDPDAIVAAGSDSAPPAGPRALDVVTIVLLLVGGVVVPVIGWLVGVVLLWSSGAWTTGRKLLGTLVWPGGLGFVLVLFVLPAFLVTSGGSSGGCIATATSGPGGRTVTSCSGSGGGSGLPGWVGLLLLAVAVLAPVVVAVDLFRHARRPEPAAPGFPGSRSLARPA